MVKSLPKLMNTIFHNNNNQSRGGNPFDPFGSGLIGLYSFDPMLSSASSSNLVRVRRSGDNAESDFTSAQVYSGDLAAFCVAGGGSQNGFVVNWYDQSGNSRTVTQATAATQLQIVTSGVLNIEGTKNRAGMLGIDVIGTSANARYMVGNLPANYGLGNITLITVARKDVNRQYQSVIHLNNVTAGGAGAGGAFCLQSTATVTSIGTHNSWVAPTTSALVNLGANSTQHMIASMRRNGGTAGNGGAVSARAITPSGGLQTNSGTQTWASAVAGNQFMIGLQGLNAAVYCWPADIQLVALYNRSLSDIEIAGIETQLRNVYGI